MVAYQKGINKINIATLVASVGLSLVGPGTAHAFDPLSIAAAGVTTSIVIERLQEKINQLIDKATHDGSLLTSKVARDIQLLIDGARQQLHDELNQQWDKLDYEKVALLRDLDTKVQAVSAGLQQAVELEDTVVLDVDGFLQRMPLMQETPSLRRIEGSTQFYKVGTSSYRIVLTGNIIKSGRVNSVEWLPNKQNAEWGTIPANWVVNFMPPYQMAIDIPGSDIKALFDEKSLKVIKYRVNANVQNRLWYEFWKPEVRSEHFNFTVQLFPKKPIQFVANEYIATKVIDEQTVLTQKGPEMFVPGCGDSGCNAYHTLCVDVPPGASPIQATDLYDSFVGWGSWNNFSVQAGSICGTYWQHSHNVGRNVSFNVKFHPLKDEKIVQGAKVTPLSVTPGEAIDYLTVRHCIDVPVVRLGPIRFNTEGVCANITPNNAGFLSYGTTYTVEFSSNMVQFDIKLRSFTGDQDVITEQSLPNIKRVKVSPLQGGTFRRQVFEPILPF